MAFLLFHMPFSWKQRSLQPGMITSLLAVPFVLGWLKAREKRISRRRVGLQMVDGGQGEGKINWKFTHMV